MASYQEISETYIELRNLCDGRIPEDCLSGNDDGFECGERYLALNWLIADVLENEANIPVEPLLHAYSLLTEEDVDEYSDKLRNWLKNR